MKPLITLMMLGLAACGQDDSNKAWHSHAGLGPHDGVAATFAGGDTTGHLELKLHDDKGDLELWLASDEAIEQPFDLPLEASIEVEFVDRQGRKVTMRPRNTTNNEDEGGNPNIRDNKTNYFIFPGPSLPGQTGEDAAWLMGKAFESEVVVRFARDGQPLVSPPFTLKPHVH